MIIIKLKDKYLIEIDKLNVILQDKEINYNKYYIIKRTVNKLLEIERLELLLQIKKTKNKFSNYIDELSNIKTLKQFLENITSSSKDIHELILKLKTHIR
jgi:hypothetical protein|nr:MAG TPA: hypothetical protein [Caudoviricetes sp.]